MDRIFAFLAKVADNAHFGKLATDIAPGIIVTLALLLILDHCTELEVFPYTNIAAYKDRADTAQARLDALVAETESTRAILLVLAADTAGSRPAASRYAVTWAHLASLQERHTAYLARVDTLRREERNASTLTTNLQVFGDNFVLLFVVGFIIGVLMAQVSGAVFYQWLFRRRFTKRVEQSPWKDEFTDAKSRTLEYHLLRAGETLAKRVPDLATSHFRYLEVAMNMILPTVALGVALWVVGMPLLGGGALGAAIALCFKAWEQFEDYQRRQLDVRTVLRADALPRAPLVQMTVDRSAPQIRLRNVGGDPIDLSGWSLVRSSAGVRPFTFPPHTDLRAYETRIVEENLRPLALRRFRWHPWPAWADSDPVSLYNREGKLVTRVL